MMYSNRDIELETKLQNLKEDIINAMEELDSFIQSDEQTDFSVEYIERVRDSLGLIVEIIWGRIEYV